MLNTVGHVSVNINIHVISTLQLTLPNEEKLTCDNQQVLSSNKVGSLTLMTFYPLTHQ